MSDVPLGAMLSGGLDSSLIVALMARHMSEPRQDLLGRLRRRGLRARATPAGWPTWNGADHHELEVTLKSDPDELARLVWHLDEPLADLSVARLPRRSASSRAEQVTVALSGQGADELLGGYRKHRVASLAEALGARARPAARGRRRRAAPRPGPRRPARGRPPGRRTRSRACSRRAASCTPTCAPTCSPARSPSTPGAAEARAARPARRRARRRAARGRALPGRAARPRRRHAHLLRPRLDGLLARGPRAVPRPRAGGALRAHPGRAQGAPAPGQARAAPGRARPRARLRARQAQARLLQRGRRRLGRAPAAAPWSTSCCSAPTPPTRRVLDRGAVRAGRRASGAAGAPATRTCCSRSMMLELWLGEYLPRAMAAEPGAGGRVTRAALRGRHARPQRGAQPPAARRRRSPRRRCRPREWIVVDDGSTDATPARARRAGRRARLGPAAARAERRRNEQLAAGRRERARPRSASGSASRALSEPVDVVIKVDADVDFDADFCERLIGALRRRRPARHRERHLLRARGRRVGAPDEGRHDRLGRHARLPRGLPRRT